MAEPRIAICGSIAFDTICVFPGRFGDHILPHATHKISVSFLVQDLRREFGGCAGNIAYNLAGIGGAPVVCATVGHDAGDYLERLRALGVALDGVQQLAEHYTAQCHITTDLDDNQITSFHPGAMFESHRIDVTALEGIALAIVAPDGREGMFRHARGFARRGIPFVFDPGQAMPAFSGQELLELAQLADWVAMNDYEAELFVQKTGCGIETLARQKRGVVVTLGAEGARIYEGERLATVPAVPAQSIVDPTGCGDAFRAGLLYGLAHGWALEKAARLGSLLGSIKIASRGGQNHRLEASELRRRFEEIWAQAW
ncbi:MAG: carbohydrate kinase family protein [Casimicrobiaceae bacterium]|nr:carbohydrate kinase family protein [Casimicrobiaceae bacterium]MDW8311484.1 carbohydrate kinase family protein [Burkholderiales bacterium]